MNGFKLSSLPKLTAMKTNSGETLQQYIVNKLFEQMPEALSLSADMPSLAEARLVLFTRLSTDLKKMQSGKHVLVRLQALVSESTRYFDKASAKLTEALSDFKELVDYFGEDPSTAVPDTLFSLLINFIRSVESAASVADEKARRLARVDLFKRIS